MATLALTGYTSAYYGALTLGGQTCRPVRPVSCTTAGPPNTGGLTAFFAYADTFAAGCRQAQELLEQA